MVTRGLVSDSLLLMLRWEVCEKCVRILVLNYTEIITVTEYLWGPISWEHRALTGIKLCIFITFQNTCTTNKKHTNTQTHAQRHTHTHTHTHTHEHMHTNCTPLHTHTLLHTANTHILVMGLVKNRRKKMTNWSAEEKRWVFSFDLKEASEEACLTERGREFQMTPLI